LTKKSRTNRFEEYGKRASKQDDQKDLDEKEGECGGEGVPLHEAAIRGTHSLLKWRRKVAAKGAAACRDEGSTEV
jgi:hypothetical protein